MLEFHIAEIKIGLLVAPIDDLRILGFVSVWTKSTSSPNGSEVSYVD